ncbi:MAG: metal ABC transporter substrate-binding protein [Planctomycetota bacterium]|nr:metal ABC transporter substrate-binding protein [Planctomycetota bacterium]
MRAYGSQASAGRASSGTTGKPSKTGPGRRRNWFLVGVVAAGLGTLAGCDGRAGPADIGVKPASESQQPFSAVVTIAPLAGLIQPLLPHEGTVTILMTPGRSEHGYEFKPSDIAQLSQADLVVYVGLGLEPAIDTFIARQRPDDPGVVRLSTALGLESALPSGDSHADHDHAAHDAQQSAQHHAHSGGDGHVHSESCVHGPIDQHLWLDPVLMLEALPAMKAAVASAMKARGMWTPAAEAKLDGAETYVRRRIESVDAAWRSQLAPFQGRAIVTHHAAFGRPAYRYGLNIAAVIRPIEHAEPTPGDVAAAMRAIERQNASVVFFEPQFDKRAAERIAQAAKVRMESLDPLGTGDWFELMDANLASLVRGLSPSPVLSPAPPVGALPSPAGTPSRQP